MGSMAEAGGPRSCYQAACAHKQFASSASIRACAAPAGASSRRTACGSSYVASGLITSDAEDDLAYRLRELYEGLVGVIASFKPQEAAVEETFVNKDARATLKLGQARGMALLAPAQKGLRGRRVSAQRRQEDGDRHRPRREAPDRGHDRLPAAEGEVRERRRGRRARHRHLPRQPPPERAGASPRARCGGRWRCDVALRSIRTRPPPPCGERVRGEGKPQAAMLRESHLLRGSPHP